MFLDIKPEATSLCRKGRVDVFMTHKTDLLKKYPIAIELKKKGVKGGSELGRWLNQAAGYAKMQFCDHPTRIIVFPQVSFEYLQEGTEIISHDVYSHDMRGVHYNVNSFLWQAFDVGELQKYKTRHGKMAYRIVINCMRVWDSIDPWYFNIDKLDKL